MQANQSKQGKGGMGGVAFSKVEQDKLVELARQKQYQDVPLVVTLHCIRQHGGDMVAVEQVLADYLGFSEDEKKQAREYCMAQLQRV